MNPLLLAVCKIALYTLGMLSAAFVLHVIFARATGRSLFYNPKCSFRGHLWHEGEDTAVTVRGEKGSGYHMQAYTWKCYRCAAQTGEGEAPPKNSRWDHSWVSPDDDPHQGFRGGICFLAYRHLRDTVGKPAP